MGRAVGYSLLKTCPRCKKITRVRRSPNKWYKCLTCKQSFQVDVPVSISLSYFKGDKSVKDKYKKKR